MGCKVVKCKRVERVDVWLPTGVCLAVCQTYQVLLPLISLGLLPGYGCYLLRSWLLVPTRHWAWFDRSRGYTVESGMGNEMKQQRIG